MLRERLKRLEAARPKVKDAAEEARAERYGAALSYFYAVAPGFEYGKVLRPLMERGHADQLTDEDRAFLSEAPECHLPPLEVVRDAVRVYELMWA